jgi:hypothetical protein
MTKELQTFIRQNIAVGPRNFADQTVCPQRLYPSGRTAGILLLLILAGLFGFPVKPLTQIMVAESVYRVFTFGQEHQHPVIILLPGIQTPIPLALFDNLAGRHYQLELLAGLVARAIQGSTTLNRQMEPSVIPLSAAIWRANLSLSTPLLVKYLTPIPNSFARDSQLSRTCAVSLSTQPEKSLSKILA